MINIDVMHTPTAITECMTTQDKQWVALQDEHLEQLKEYIIQGWLMSRNKIQQELRPYLTFKDNLAVLGGIIMKGRCIIIPEEFQKQALDQL